MIDLSAGPCTYGKIETEEGSVNPKTLPRLQSLVLPRSGTVNEQSAHDIFVGQLAAVIATTVEHVITPDIRYINLIRIREVQLLYFSSFKFVSLLII